MMDGATLGADPALDVHLLGMVDFESALVLQERLVEEIAGRNDRNGALLLCEHPPLLTIGREGSRAHLQCDARELAARRLEVRWINRGGGCLVHLPGQLVIYLILPVERLGIGIDEFRERNETAVLDLCRRLKVQATLHPDAPGIWGRTGQLAHLGAAWKGGVSYHGLFLNVNPAMDWLRLVRPAPGDGRIGSLAAECQRPISMSAIRTSVIQQLADRWNYPQFHLYTGHPLLRRTRRKLAYA